MLKKPIFRGRRILRQNEADKSRQISNISKEFLEDMNKVNSQIKTDIVDINIFLQQWRYIKNEPLKSEIPEIKFNVDFNFYHYGDKSNQKVLVVFPGFSTQSLQYTIGRINNLKDIILAKGFSDIYIFDYKTINKVPINLKNIYNIPFELTCRIFSNHIKKILEKFTNLSLLGTSAGAGLAIQVGFDIKQTKGLYITCPGFETMDVVKSIKENPDKKNLPIRMSWSKEDQKINISEGYKLENIFKKYKINNFKFLKLSSGKKEDVYNHRIHPEIINILN